MDRQSSLARSALARARREVATFAREHLPDDRTWCVALSGGPDSLALTAAAATVLPTTALIVDHALQPGSAAVAEAARQVALDLGCAQAQILTVSVGTRGGPEAAARTARYAALEQARAGAPVLLGHTLDDQAETVLLGLGRGSGPRSIAGMRPCDPPWFRPLLGLRRTLTEAVCAELGLTAWEDPHNSDPRFTRARLRHEVLPLLEQVLGGGAAEALARTAGALRQDNDALDAQAQAVLVRAVTAEGLQVVDVVELPDAVRLRVVRGWLLAGGARGLTDTQIRAVDALISSWHGQGGAAVGGSEPSARLLAERHGPMLRLRVQPI